MSTTKELTERGSEIRQENVAQTLASRQRWQRNTTQYNATQRNATQARQARQHNEPHPNEEVHQTR